MPSYRAPVDDVKFLLNDVFHIDRYANLPGFSDATPDVVDAIIGEAAKLCEQVLTPLSQNSIMGTPPDQDSIMCYQLPGSITKSGQPIRGGRDINATDHAFAGRIYPKVLSEGAPSIQAEMGLADEWSASEDVEVDEELVQ